MRGRKKKVTSLQAEPEGQGQKENDPRVASLQEKLHKAEDVRTQLEKVKTDQQRSIDNVATIFSRSLPRTKPSTTSREVRHPRIQQSGLQTVEADNKRLQSTINVQRRTIDDRTEDHALQQADLRG